MDDFLEKLKKDRDAVKKREAAGYHEVIKKRNDPVAKRVERQEAEKAAADRGFFSRAGDTLKGIGHRQAEGYAGALEAGVELLGKAGSALQDRKERQQAAQDRAYLEQYRQELAAAKAAGDARAIKTAQLRIKGAEKRLEMNGSLGDYYDQVNAEAARKVSDFGDRHGAQAEQAFQRAKAGTGKAGSLLVDVGAGLGDVLGDAAANAALPGLGTAARVARSFGHGAEAAEEKGVSIGRQALYGAGSAALGEGVNRLFSGNPILEKATGKGALDDLLFPSLGKTLPGRMVKSGIGEGIEEGTESLLDPLVQLLTMGQKNTDPLDLKSAGYDALVGAMIGGLTGISAPKQGHDVPVQAAGTPPADTVGADAPTAQDGAQGITGAKKAAPEVGAVNENGLNAFSEQERVNLSSGKKNKVISTFGEAVSFVKNALSNKQNVDRAYLGKVPDSVAHTIRQNTGLDIRGFGVMLNGNDIRHIIKNHGDILVEQARGQVAVTADDIARIPEILAAPDRVYLSDETDTKGRKTLVFEKRIGDKYISIQGVSDGKRVLQTDTLYISKGRPRMTRDTMPGTESAVPVINAQGEPSQKSSSIDSTIPQDAEYVNSVDPLLEAILGSQPLDEDGYLPDELDALPSEADGGMMGETAEQEEGYGRTAAQTDPEESDGLLRSGGQGPGADRRRAESSAGFLEREHAEGRTTRTVGGIGYAERNEPDHDTQKRSVAVRGVQEAHPVHGDVRGVPGRYSEGDQVRESDLQGARKSRPEVSTSGEIDQRVTDGLGAADAGFDPYSRLQNQTDQFHPEGAYAARPVEVPMEDFDGRNIPKSASTVMGAQGTTDSGVRELERQIAAGELSFDTIHDADAVRQAQRTIAGKGFDGAMEQYRQAVAASVATKDNTALGQQLLLQAMREGDERATAELVALYTRNSTTAAQAMQAQSIFRKLSPEGQLVAVQKAVSALNEKHGTKVELDPEDVADFLSAKTEKERRKVTERMVEKAAKSVPGTFRAKFDTLRYLAMLGNPRTHIRNILGNTLFQVPVAVKNRVGAVAEAIAYRASGGKTERTKALFGASPFGKLAAEARADWANVKDFLGQSGKYRDEQTSLWDIEQKADAFSDKHLVGRAVNKAADFNSRALEAEDTAAKKWIYTQSLAGYLKANGCGSMADADTALLNRARDYAAQEALRNTFNDKNVVSDAVSRLGRMTRSDNPVVQGAGYVTEGILPFKRTPANIAVRAMEYSPVGMVLGAVETVRGAKSGDMARVAAGLDRAAAGVSGTALLAAGFLAAGAGYVTGGEDDDEKQAAFDDLTGHQNYALELKNGLSITLDWLAPEAIPFFMGVELYEQGLEGGLSWDEALEAVKNASAPMLEMSMLQGLNDAFDNAAYAKDRGDSVFAALVTSALTNYFTQLFPTIGGQLERSGEEVRMTTYIDKNKKLPTDLQYTLGKVSQKIPIPGWDYQQIPYLDAWGREEETGDALERSVNSLFNPAYVSQVDVDKVERELQRVKDATGDSGVFPQRAGRSIEYTPKGKEQSVRHELTAEQYTRYAKKLGQESYAIVKQGIATKAYRGMTDAEKAEYLDSLYSYADQMAKASMFRDYPTQAKYANAHTAKQDIGVSPAEYLALYEEYGSGIMSGKAYEKTKQAVKAGLSVPEYAAMRSGIDADGNGSVSQKEAQGYLDRQPFSNGVKADLWEIINSSWKKNPYT